jgi:hypothetical protein
MMGCYESAFTVARLDNLELPPITETTPDLFWSFHNDAWVTRRSVLYFFLAPRVPPGLPGQCDGSSG